MDIHRARFVSYPSSAINCLSFSHPSSSTFNSVGADPLRLAIGRANGNIEIWNPARGSWVHETTFSGGKDRSVEGLAWIQDPDEVDEKTKYRTLGRLRLFSIGYSSAVTEWDLTTGLPRRHSAGNYGVLWCLAAQPHWRSASKSNGVKGDGKQEQKHKGEQPISEETSFRGQNLVAGCEDGQVVVLSTADDDLKFKRFLARPTAKKSRALSVAFQNRDVVVVGFASSSIGIFDVRTGSNIRNISLGSVPRGGPKENLVWTVKCLPDGTIVSGDSTGEIGFYDGVTYSQLQRISGHEADILDLVVSEDGNNVFSGGMDRRTVHYKKVETAQKRTRWAKVSHSRFHKHDVKAMATYESKSLSVIASGGLDTNITMIPLREFGNEHHRTISGLPQRPPLASARSGRLLVSWWDQEVLVWRIRDHSEGRNPYKLVTRVALKADENVTCATISDEGSVLVVSTVAEVKLFTLFSHTSNHASRLDVRKTPSSHLPRHGARILLLSTNGKWLVTITPANRVYLTRINPPGSENGHRATIPGTVELKRLHRNNQKQNALNGVWGRYDRTITHAQFSHGDDVLVVADLAGYMDTWTVEGYEDPTAPAVDVSTRSGASSRSSSSPESDSEDSEAEDGRKSHTVFYGQHWIRTPTASLLPKLSSAPLLLLFRPPPPTSSHTPRPNGNPAVHPTRAHPHAHSHTLPASDPGAEHRLLVLTAAHQLLEFDALAGGLTPWSRRNGADALLRGLPHEVGNVRDRVMGGVWDVCGEWARAWLYGSSWVVMLDLAQDVPIPEDDVAVAGAAVLANGASKGGKEGGEAKGTKRKRDKIRRGVSGAGSKLPERELTVGRKVRKIVNEDGVRRTEHVRLDAVDDEESGSDDEDGEGSDDGDVEGLAVARRRMERSGADGTVVNGQGSGRDVEPGALARTEAKPRRWWYTYKYRPILGMVPIAPSSSSQLSREAEQEEGEGLPEVVLVERPFWDLDLPPRFVGVHERER